MRISFNWLRELVNFDFTARELAEKLTMAGLAVDTVEPVGDDFLLEFDLTSNRPDALSHLGIARELSVICGRPLKYPETEVVEDEQPASAVTSVAIQEPDLCPRYVARMIMDVRVGPSPRWLVERLERLGQRSINNVADITNLVLREMGHPTHAFDFEKLVGRRIVVRRARPGELLVTLDGVKRTLTEDMLVIADAERAVAMAGIMGGEESEISFQTEHVLLESAYFQPQSIRRTARALGMETDASYHFERGMDYEIPPQAADRVARLIAEIAGGRVLQGAIDAYPQPIQHQPIRLRHERLVRIIGFEVPMDKAERILRDLSFNVQRINQDELTAVAPSWRIDIDGEDDLVEEVARHVGYEKITLELPAWAGAGEYLPGEDRRRDIRKILTTLGFDEAITLSFVGERLQSQFGSNGANAEVLLNPIDETRPVLRTTLLPGLLESLLHNINHGVRNVRLFEMGKCFFKRGDNQLPIEREHLGFVATGLVNEFNWKDHKEVFTFYHLKAVLESLLEKFRIRGQEFVTSTESYLHTGQAARLIVDGEELAVFGQLHPRVAAELKFKQPVFVGELNLERLLALEGEPVRYQPLSRYPTVVRDVSFILPVEIPYGDVEAAVRDLGIEEIVSVQLFDVYTGKPLPPGKRSLSISLRMRAADHTLTEEEINRYFGQVIALLREKFGAEIRE
ncbi:MAG: phenylalanine--tRNA ligase subunit beta [Acidobacteria bacterium]|nr:phenylalanine--tRNA ligase subunit beta [Acidobacteriota bacterium]